MSTSTGERMTTLAESFPALRGRPGVRPWDAHVLDAWAAKGEGGSNALHAARFVLALWFPSHTSAQCGAFDLHAALRVWDEAHRAAFTVWSRDPWWP